MRKILEKTGFRVEYVKQDRNFLGLKRTLLILDRKPTLILRMLMAVKPAMQAVEYALLLMGKGDGLIVCAQKP